MNGRNYFFYFSIAIISLNAWVLIFANEYEIRRIETVSDEFYHSIRNNDKEMLQDLRIFLREQQNSLQHRNSTLVWNEEGPDNFGGRTRAICIDRNDANHIFAGSVSGGLFVSNNGGNNWTVVPGFFEYLRISSMCQTLDGTYYVGTGCTAFDNWSGDGIWSSSDNGVTWTLVPNSANWLNIYELEADPIIADRIWIAGSHSTLGAQSYTPSVGFTVISGMTGLTYYDVKVSPDGAVMVYGKLSGGIVRTFVSTDNGVTFTDVSGSGSTQIPNSGRTRIEYAISTTKNGNNMWMIYASSHSTNNDEFHISEDNGQTWYLIGSETSFFDPLAGQGGYANIITAIPGQEKFLLGGRDIWLWEKSIGTVPPFGQWYQKTMSSLPTSSPIYLHQNQHEMQWDQNGVLYLGNNGGIAKSFDGGNQSWIEHNRGYNVTQFYSVAFNKYGHTLGGTQDNGTVYKNFTGTTSLEYQKVLGSDGFDCDISHISSEVMFATVYYGDLNRSADEGNSWTSFEPLPSGPLSGLPYFTVCRLYENKNDTDSQDSVQFIAGNNYAIGDTIFYESNTLQQSLQYILQAPLLQNDSINLQDPVQSIFAIGYNGSNGVWLTRHSLRFAGAPTWKKVIPNVNGMVTCIEFSSDGKVMYVGSSGGTLYVVEGLNTFYSPANDISGVTVQAISSFGYINGIGVDPQDNDHIIVMGGTSLRESFTATTASSVSSFLDASGNLPDVVIYDGIIDHLDPSTYVIGTEYGAYVSDNGGTTWTYQTEMGLVPVFAVRQQWRTSDCWNSGAIYLGTHGRGIWSSNSLVGINEPDNTAVASTFVTEIKTFPNPMNSNGTISFKLKERNNVDIFVMDLTGKIVLTHNLGTLNQGDNRITINVEGLASGTYVVSIKAGDEIGTDKLIVMH